MPRMERMPRIDLTRRIDLLDVFFCYLKLRVLFASHCQPERQFPKNPGPPSGAVTPLRTLRLFPQNPRFPRNPFRRCGQPERLLVNYPTKASPGLN